MPKLKPIVFQLRYVFYVWEFNWRAINKCPVPDAAANYMGKVSAYLAEKDRLSMIASCERATAALA